MKPKKTEMQPRCDEEKLLLAQKHADAKKAAVEDVLKRFESLPDDAHVRLLVVMVFFACSAVSAWRYAMNGSIPAPRKFGSRVIAWNVGKLRASLAA